MFIAIGVHHPHVQSWLVVHFPLARLLDVDANPAVMADASLEGFVLDLVLQARKQYFLLRVVFVALPMVELKIRHVVDQRGFDSSRVTN